MSAKVYRGEQASKAAPIEWQDRTRAGMRGEPAAAGTGESRSGSNPEGEPTERERTAYSKGLQDGQAAARHRFDTEQRPLAENLTKILSSFSGIETRVRREAEDDLVELSMAIARRILHRELTLDPEAVGGLVKAAFGRIGSRGVNRVRTHPSHAGYLQSVLREARPQEEIDVITDPTLSPGDLLFETERGDLDATIDSQLEEIRRGLADRLRVNR